MFSPWLPVFLFKKRSTISDPTLLKEIEDAYTNLKPPDEDSSLMRRFLTDDIFHVLKFKLTLHKSNLLDLIRPGCDHPKTSFGLTVPDADAYQTFMNLLYPIIEEYHDYKIIHNRPHPTSFYGPPEIEFNLDPEGVHIKEFRLTGSRNVAGYPFVPKMDYCDFDDIEVLMHNWSRNLPSGLRGTLYSLDKIPYEVRQQMADDDAYFCDNDPFLESAGVYKHWPLGRAIFQSNNRLIYILVNQMDHFLLISREIRGDWTCAVKRFRKALEIMERNIKFAYHDNLGVLTSSPGALGLGMRVMCRMHLPKLNDQVEVLEMICRNNALMCQSQDNAIFDIINKKILGVREHDILKNMKDGLVTILDIEKSVKMA